MHNRVFMFLSCFFSMLVISSRAQFSVPAFQGPARGKAEVYYERIKDYEDRLQSIPDSFMFRSPLAMIGDCFDSLGNKEMAKKYYRDAIKKGDFDVSFMKRKYAASLAAIFVSESNFDSAYYYLDYVRKLKSIRNMCGSGRALYQYKYYYWWMRTYHGLGKLDSAINCFSIFPFEQAFASPGEASPLHYYPGDYHCMVDDWLKILSQKFSAAQVDKELCLLLEQTDIAFKDYEVNGKCYRNFRFATRFMGVEHVFYDESYDWKVNGYWFGPTDIEENRRRAIIELQSSYIYLIKSGFTSF